VSSQRINAANDPYYRHRPRKSFFLYLDPLQVSPFGFGYVTFFRSHTSIVVATLIDFFFFLAWQDGWHTEDLLRPVFMGCATKNAEVITIARGSLQRLISLRAVSLSAVTVIILTANDCMASTSSSRVSKSSYPSSLISPSCAADCLQTGVLQFHFRAVPVRLLYLVPIDDEC